MTNFEWSPKAVQSQSEVNEQVRQLMPEGFNEEALRQQILPTLVKAREDVGSGGSGRFVFLEGPLDFGLKEQAVSAEMFNTVGAGIINEGDQCLAVRVAMKGSGKGGWVVVRGSTSKVATPPPVEPPADKDKFCQLLALLDAEATLTGDYAGMATLCGCPTTTTATCDSCTNTMSRDVDVTIAGVTAGIGNPPWSGLIGFINDNHPFEMVGCSSNVISDSWSDPADPINNIAASLFISHGFNGWTVRLDLRVQTLVGIDTPIIHWRIPTDGDCEADYDLASNHLIGNGDVIRFPGDYTYTNVGGITIEIKPV